MTGNTSSRQGSVKFLPTKIDKETKMLKEAGKALVCVMLGLSLFTAGCSRKTQNQAGGGKTAQQSSIQIKGSDTMVNLGQAWAEAFMKKSPEVSVAVTGGGSGTGFAALINGTTDVAEASRAIKPEEIAQAKQNKIDPKEFKVALDGIAVVVNPKNKIDSLTVDQLADIFTCKIKDWKEVGGEPGKIVILSREVNSGTHVYFKEHVLNKGDSKGAVEFSKDALMMPSSQAIADEVAQNPAAIGYYGVGYISAKQKALGIAAKAGDKFIKPSVETVVSGVYPISRPLFMYTKGEPAGAVKQLMDFVLSPDGQKVVSDAGFVPLPK
jgi:phosphate transport system substrate-binding protein